MNQVLKVTLRSGKDEAVRRFHPWVFSGAIKKMEGPAFDGCRTEVFSNKGEYLACGIYQDASIAVRLLAFAPERPEGFSPAFWLEKLQAAWQLRRQCGLTHSKTSNIYRLVHGEGDHLPGLIIDHYDGHLVIQIHATGLYGYIDQIAEGLRALYGQGLKSIYDKSRETLPEPFWKDNSSRGFIHPAGDLPAGGGVVEAMENNLRFMIDIPGGQKTGFFIDQRENRMLLSHYAPGKKILNAFAYSGAFSVYALRAGAREVHSLDSSLRATQLCQQNATINRLEEKHRIINSDAMDYLRSCTEAYDLMILDPPAYAKHQRVKHKAVQGYKRLNLQALKVIAPQSLLFTFSCSQVIDLNLFKSTITSAAILSGRKVRILHQLSQGPDHPTSIFHPEGHYLKGLVLHVD